MALDKFRILEFIGGGCCVVFAILGVSNLINADYSLDNFRATMQHFAVTSFLIMYGVAGSLACFFPGKVQVVGQYFGHLCLWTGRGVFFLVMGSFVYPSIYTGNRWRKQTVLETCSLIASIASICLGVTILALRIFGIIAESLGGDLLGQKKHMNRFDVAAAVASGGMCVMAVMMITSLDFNSKYVKLSLFRASMTFIVLIYGVSSLLSSFFSGGLAMMMFGFLGGTVSRGLFYLLMGMFMIAYLVDPSSMGEVVCWICSAVSILVGAVLIFLGLN